MKHTLITFMPLVACVLATPATKYEYECEPIRQTYTAKYDDLSFVEPGPNPIPPHYYGLSYITFQTDQDDGWLPPTSLPNRAMAFGGIGNITVPDQPPKQTLQLHSFSYACSAGVPQPACAISMWGWKTTGRVIYREIIFPKLDPGHFVEEYVMNHTTFSHEWQGLKSLGFSISRKDNGGDMFGGLALDDFKYTITTKC